MLKKKALLFDFDGVIVNTFEMCYQMQKNFEWGVSRKAYRERFKGKLMHHNDDHPFRKAPPPSQLLTSANIKRYVDNQCSAEERTALEQAFVDHMTPENVKRYLYHMLSPEEGDVM